MEGEKMDNNFAKLYKLNVNEYVEKKNGLTYLSWANGWAEFKKVYPDATYEVVKFDGKPYIYDENLGYMCYTKVTADGLTHEMWLPVMDGANKAMKAFPYEYSTKYGKKTCEAATMFDVNKTIMRCLVKNLAMFGLGLYIYAGEDLPDSSEETVVPAKQEKKSAPKSAPKKETKEESKIPMCAHCLKPIPAHDEYTPQQVASLTMHNLKKQLCWDCAHDFQEKIKAEQEKKQAEDAKANAPEPEYVIDEQTNLPFPMEN
jgi:hypothetical protein